MIITLNKIYHFRCLDSNTNQMFAELKIELTKDKKKIKFLCNVQFDKQCVSFSIITWEIKRENNWLIVNFEDFSHLHFFSLFRVEFSLAHIFASNNWVHQQNGTVLTATQHWKLVICCWIIAIHFFVLFRSSSEKENASWSISNYTSLNWSNYVCQL